MKVKHVMTKDPRCCVPSDTAQRAATIMRDENAGLVPVVENEHSQKVVGVVTDRDLCMNIVAEGRDSRTTQVHECMTTSVVTCLSQDSVEKVTDLMREGTEGLFVPANETAAFADAVCALLAELSTFSEIRTHVFATVRSDYLPALFEIPALFEHVKNANGRIPVCRDRQHRNKNHRASGSGEVRFTFHRFHLLGRIEAI